MYRQRNENIVGKRMKKCQQGNEIYSRQENENIPSKEMKISQAIE
jgi:hypothetical protein